jgi:N-acyl-D-aspartate/D-glutamate deacylase
MIVSRIEEQTETLQRLLREAVDANGQLNAAKSALDVAEAEIRLLPDIDGKNAETREAQFTLLCARDAMVQSAHDLRDDAEANLALYRADIEVCRETIKTLRLQAEFELEQLRAARA